MVIPEEVFYDAQIQRISQVLQCSDHQARVIYNYAYEKAHRYELEGIARQVGELLEVFRDFQKLEPTVTGRTPSSPEIQRTIRVQKRTEDSPKSAGVTFHADYRSLELRVLSLFDDRTKS